MMDMIAVLTPLLVAAFLVFLAVRLFLKCCRPSVSPLVVSPDTAAPDLARVFVSSTPHTYSRIYVDESSNVRSVTIARIAPNGHIVGYVLDPNALMPIHHHHLHHSQPPTYEDSIKSFSPPKYDMTPANSTTRNSMELPTSSATTARVDGARLQCSPRLRMPSRSMSDSWLPPSEEEKEDGLQSAR